jgi:SAM-dependent methyltransferase
MKKAMDLIGLAVKDIIRGEKSDFTFIDTFGHVSTHDLERYLRKPSQLIGLEKQLIKKSKGSILDIGCATGYYLPLLMKKGKVVGIDISDNLVDVARKNGLRNCFVGDIFKYKFNEKFDSITLLENNIGLGGSIVNTKKLLNKLKILLNKNGQILMIIRNIDGRNYFKIKLRPCWRGIEGDRFEWISFNVNYLKDLLLKLGFNVEFLGEDEKSFLIKAVIK